MSDLFDGAEQVYYYYRKGTDGQPYKVDECPFFGPISKHILQPWLKKHFPELGYVTPGTLETVEGIVVETDELVLETANGLTVQVGLGPSQYRASQGFVLNVNDAVRVTGYWEDDEFKATRVDNLENGTSIVLRDPSGRPMWAGQGCGQNRSS